MFSVARRSIQKKTANSEFLQNHMKWWC